MIKGMLDTYDVDFTFKWSGEKEIESPYWHEPGVMGAGKVIASTFRILNENLASLVVFIGNDGFAGSHWSESITITVHKNEEYRIWVEENHLKCDKEFVVRDFDAEREKRLQELRASAKNHMRLVQNSNPTILGDKIELEFAKESPEGSSVFVKGTED